MFRCYRQIEYSDCGLTCIRMVAKAFGVEVPIRYLHEISDLNRLGMSIRDITECCSKIGLDSKAVRIGTNRINGMPLPAILYWQQCHFVVLFGYDQKNKKFKIADPAQGKITYSEQEFRRYWIPEGSDKGVAILVDPNDDFFTYKYKKHNSLKSFFGYITSFIRLYKFKFIFAIFITLILMAADLLVPLLLKKTIDEGIGLHDVGLVITLLLGQLAITIGGLVASNGMSYLLTRSGLRIHLDMVNSFLEKLARFPMSFFDKKVSADFVKKLDDHSRIKNFLMNFPNSVFTMVLTSFVFSILLFHYSILIFTIFIIMSFIEVFWNTLFLNRRKTLDYAYFLNASANQNLAYELTNGMADLKVNNAEASRIGKWKRTQVEINKVSIKTFLLNMAQNGGHTILSRMKDLVVTGVGATLVITGDFTLGTLMTLGYITGRLSQPFSTLGSSIKSLQEAYISYQRVEDVIQDTSEIQGEAKFSEASISFSEVDFKYPGASSPFVLKNIDLFVEKGKVTALVGESGCGKSTLIKLMLGFYIPQKGSLKLSGIDISEIDRRDWMRHCGVVMQEARIFSESILENISLSDSTPDINKALGLLETVGLSDYIEKLPMGIHTKIGVSGIEMSGGQKQRLMIARALYKDPDILFLDEATSSLDANNEKNIVSNISSIGRGKTIVIAAHRLSTVQNADKIVFIKNGQIIEQGTHKQLLELRGAYWNLVKNQLQLSL